MRSQHDSLPGCRRPRLDGGSLAVPRSRGEAAATRAGQLRRAGDRPGKNDLTRETSLMNRNASTADRDSSLATFAAELTQAAYAVALRHERPDSWIDLELDLWRALGDTVQR